MRFGVLRRQQVGPVGLDEAQPVLVHLGLGRLPPGGLGEGLLGQDPEVVALLHDHLGDLAAAAPFAAAGAATETGAGSGDGAGAATAGRRAGRDRRRGCAAPSPHAGPPDHSTIPRRPGATPRLSSKITGHASASPRYWRARPAARCRGAARCAHLLGRRGGVAGGRTGAVSSSTRAVSTGRPAPAAGPSSTSTGARVPGPGTGDERRRAGCTDLERAQHERGGGHQPSDEHLHATRDERHPLRRPVLHHGPDLDGEAHHQLQPGHPHHARDELDEEAVGNDAGVERPADAVPRRDRPVATAGRRPSRAARARRRAARASSAVAPRPRSTSPSRRDVTVRRPPATAWRSPSP